MPAWPRIFPTQSTPNPQQARASRLTSQPHGMGPDNHQGLAHGESVSHGPKLTNYVVELVGAANQLRLFQSLHGRCRAHPKTPQTQKYALPEI